MKKVIGSHVCGVCGASGVRVIRMSIDRGQKIQWLCPTCVRDRNLRVSYGITLKQYNDIAESQGWRCAVCNRHQDEFGKGKKPKMKRLFVDHCHKTNAVRGLLCPNCNTAVGMMNEDPVAAVRFVEYLTKHKVSEKFNEPG